jgi:hypothetical protein
MCIQLASCSLLLVPHGA